MHMEEELCGELCGVCVCGKKSSKAAKSTRCGTRTRNPQIRSLIRYPLRQPRLEKDTPTHFTQQPKPYENENENENKPHTHKTTTKNKPHTNQNDHKTITLTHHTHQLHIHNNIQQINTKNNAAKRMNQMIHTHTQTHTKSTTNPSKYNTNIK